MMTSSATATRSRVLFVLPVLLLSACGAGSASSTTSVAVSTATALATAAATDTASAIISPAPSDVAAASVTETATAAPATVLAQTSPAASPSPTAEPPAPSPTSEQALAPEQNPPGDIPDSQAFVTYRSTDGGYQLDVPEGWARSTTPSEVTFVDKLDGVRVALGQASTQPSAGSVRSKATVELQRTGRAVRDVQVKDVRLPNGPAVLMAFTSNSEPNPVTGKQVRLENNSYLIYKDGKLATLTLWAPQGADNVDQWQRMAQSFRWR